ncbi:MAG: hypothetical protein GY906_12210 [bacterium]|nr:hypothetical protein [bacterium]
MAEEKHSWKIRRRFMFIVTAFSMAVILLALLVKPDTAVAGTAISFSFGTITGVLGSYVFGAVWDDKNRS